MPEPPPQFVGPAGPTSLSPPDKRSAGLSDRDQVNVWVQPDDSSSQVAPVQKSEAGPEQPAGGQLKSPESTGSQPRAMGARAIFPRSLANHLDAAMRVATMPTPPIVGGDLRLFDGPEDKLAGTAEPVTGEATATVDGAAQHPGTGDKLRSETASPAHAGGITLQAEGSQAKGPQIVVETPTQQAPTLDVGRTAASRQPAVAPFGGGFVGLGLSTGRGARGEPRLLPGSVLTTTVAPER